MKLALVIDNNTDNTKLITFILEKSGYRTIIAMDGKTGIDLARKETPDFILLDLELPDMHGLEVLKEIRKSESAQEISIIAMMPNRSNAASKAKLIEAGCTGSIERPIDSTTIIEQIRFMT